jgi:hypothetical protein
MKSPRTLTNPPIYITNPPNNVTRAKPLSRKQARPETADFDAFWGIKIFGREPMHKHPEPNAKSSQAKSATYKILS